MQSVVHIEHIENENSSNFRSTSDAPNAKYERCLFDFSHADQVVEYWRKLLHISMNTYKFCAGKFLHESKNLRQTLLSRITSKSSMSNLVDLWPIEKYGDQMGPGGYDSQLFLHSFKNWMLPSVSSETSEEPRETEETPAITKEDQSIAPFSELALSFPFGVFRGIQQVSKRSRRKAAKRKSTLDEDSDEEDSDASEASSIEKTKFSQTKASVESKRVRSVNEQKASESSLKIQKARLLLVKSKSLKAKTSSR